MRRPHMCRDCPGCICPGVRCNAGCGRDCECPQYPLGDAQDTPVAGPPVRPALPPL